MYLSKSSLNAWLQCPSKFKRLYIDKVKTETSPQAQRGLEVHQFCAEFYDHLHFKNGNFTVETEFLEPYLEMCSEDARPQIHNFIDFEQQRWLSCKALLPKNPKKLFIPLLREEKLSSDKLQQVTIIDRLDQRLDGNYTLVEYKTERFQEKEWKKTEFRREMMFEKTTCESSESFQQRFSESIVDFVVYFPRSNDVMMESFNQRTASALRKAIERMRIDIENNYYPCCEEYHCRFCPFNLSCEMNMEK
jgi:hypothetical protein